jgi:hypothetical protein
MRESGLCIVFLFGNHVPYPVSHFSWTFTTLEYVTSQGVTDYRFIYDIRKDCVEINRNTQI